MTGAIVSAVLIALLLLDMRILRRRQRAFREQPLVTARVTLGYDGGPKTTYYVPCSPEMVEYPELLAYALQRVPPPPTDLLRATRATPHR